MRDLIRTSIPERLLIKRLIIGVISLLTLVDLLSAQAIPPSLAAACQVSPAAMAIAVNACTFGMAIGASLVAALALRARLVPKPQPVIAAIPVPQIQSH